MPNTGSMKTDDRFDVFVRMDADLAARLTRQVEIAQRSMPGLKKASLVRAAILEYVEKLEQQQAAEPKKRR